jgi:16S rRNA (uracil1498-N3)-methyltransferase
MALPYFYIPAYDGTGQELMLDEDASRHIVQVLRMRPGEAVRLTDGKGRLLTAVILNEDRKKCRVGVKSVAEAVPPGRRVAIAISPLKNASRFEWFLEKATEIGVATIIPLLCERTERASLRMDRLRQIVVSAMLQSQQAWLTDLPGPMEFDRMLSLAGPDRRFIAHCLEGERPAAVPTGQASSDTLILIGPEGDFTSKEVEAALGAGFIPVSLGETRLRTETAGIVAATLLCIG